LEYRSRQLKTYPYRSTFCILDQVNYIQELFGCGRGRKPKEIKLNGIVFTPPTLLVILRIMVTFHLKTPGCSWMNPDGAQAAHFGRAQ